MSDVQPPKVFGGLLAALGLVLTGAGVTLDDRYFTVLGALWLGTGLLLYSGKKAALYLYGLTLAVVWIWSLQDAHGDMGILLPRVTLPTLVAFYLFSYRVRSRLS
jgi:glucose dehydrogenase